MLLWSVSFFCSLCDGVEYGGMHALGTHAEATEGCHDGRRFSLLLSLLWPWESPLSAKVGILASELWDLPVSVPPILGLQAHTVIPCILHGYRETSSSQDACTENALTYISPDPSLSLQSHQYAILGLSNYLYLILSYPILSYLLWKTA